MNLCYDLIDGEVIDTILYVYAKVWFNKQSRDFLLVLVTVKVQTEFKKLTSILISYVKSLFIVLYSLLLQCNVS